MFAFMAFLGVCALVRWQLPGELVTYWWLSLLAMIGMAAIFAVSLWVGADVLPRRRERMLSIVEGRV
jgi:hypothetical protein